MEKPIFKKLQKFTILFFLTISSFVWSQGSVSNINCLNHFPMQDPIRLKIINNGSDLTNAISTSQSTVVEDDGINTYTVYITTVLIPYYATSLTGEIKIETSSFCTYQYASSTHTTDAKIVVNNTVQSTNTYSITSGLGLGTHNYNTKAQVNFINGQSYICSKKYFRIKVIKESAPTFNLTLSAYCKKDNNTNLYNGYIGFNVNGTATNLSSRLYFITTNTAGTCFNSVNNPRLTDLSSTGNFANQFYNCNSSGTYIVYLSHRFQNIVGSSVIHDLVPGEQGWNNYTYNKTFKSCQNIMDPKLPDLKEKSANPNDLKKAMIYPNPANEKLSVTVPEETIKKLIIYNHQNTKLFEIANSTKSDTVEIGVDHLKSGMYIISIDTEQSNHTQKFLKN